MKLVIILLTAGILHVSAAAVAQKITLNEKKATLEQVLKQIRQQSGYDFIYSDNMLDKSVPVTINLKDATLDEALKAALKDQPMTFEIEDSAVVFKVKEPSFIDKLKNAFAAIEVTGRVTDENNQPLSGATVTVKNTNNATNTDANGVFTLKNVQPDAIIVISFIGYDKKEISAKSDLGAIKLIQASSKLDEVKVIAYGQTTERLSVGDISSVSAKTIEKQPVNNPLLALEGQVPGLFISQVTGNAGGSVKVVIQGQNSILNGNNPFFVVDGVPYMDVTLPNFGISLFGSVNGSPFSYMNPQDIENITVLKDADATAIYGSRAANGAILITTKKGKNGATRVDFNIQNGWGNVPRKLNLLNTQQYLEMRHEALKNDGLNPGLSDYDITSWDTTRNTDWQKELLGGTANYKDYNVSVSGGNEQVQYLVGSTFHRETTVLPWNYADTKGSVHFSLTTQSLNKRFRMQFTGSYLHDNNVLPRIDITANALELAPDAPPLYNSNGKVNWAINNSGTATFTNNPAYSASGEYSVKADNLISNAQLSYEIISGLVFKTSLGYTELQDNELQTLPGANANPIRITTFQRSASYTFNNTNSWIIEPQITYTHNFGKNKLDAIIGGTASQNNGKGLMEVGTGYLNDLLLADIKSATTVVVNSSSAPTYKYNAVFGRITDGFDEKYLLNATMRRDGSSRFGPANEFHNFWSLGAGWIFTKEKVIAENMPWLSFGKLRASYGTTGNDQIGDYQYLSTYTSTYGGYIPYQGVSSLQTAGPANPYLQWEETHKLSLGAELSFFKDRIILNADYFRNRTSNQLLFYSTPVLTGFYGYSANFPATVQNSGLEFQINTINFRGKGLSWQTSFNLTIPRNKLMAFPSLATSAFANSLIIGQPATGFFVYKSAGVNPTSGQYQFVDSNGQLTPTPDKPTAFISTDPKFYGGFNNSLSYKRFDLSVFFNFAKQIARGYYFGGLVSPGRFNAGLGNQPVSVLDRWQNNGNQVPVQKFSSNFSVSTPFNEIKSSDAAYTDASYIRLKNVSLSYNLPENWTKHVGMKSCRLSLNGQNLLTFTKYTGLDPESASATYLPPLRVYTFGIQAGF